VSYSGHTFNGDVENRSELAANELKAIAQRLDRLQGYLSQLDLADQNNSFNPSEIIQQLQQDAATLQQTADRITNPIADPIADPITNPAGHKAQSPWNPQPTQPVGCLNLAQAEAQLQMQERFYKAFGASPVAMCISRLADGLYVEVNDRFLELVEYTREELIGRTSIELGIFQPQERAFLLSLLIDTPGPAEWWFHTRTGKRRLARISSETFDLNNEPHLLVLVEDITDYRRVQVDLQQLNDELESIVQQRTQALQASEAALKTSQRQLEAVLDNSPLLIYLLDLDNRHLMVNRRYAEVVGISRQELIGLPVEDALRDADIEVIGSPDNALLEHLQQVRETGQTIEVEEAFYIRQQKRIYLSSKFPLFDSGGNLYAVGGICLDMTERMRVEEERQRAEAVVAQREREYRTLVENSPDLIMRVDRQRRFVYVSPSFALAFGVSQQDCIGKTGVEVNLPSDMATSCRQQLENLFDRCEQQMLEFTIQSAEGLRFHQSWAVPELDEQGNVGSALIIGRDITQMKQAEQRLQQAVIELERVNRLKDEFLSTVSHELRTPVSNMKLSIRMVEVALQQANFEPDTRLRQYLDILNRECDREISLINDLLDLQRLEANKCDLALEPIDLERWLPRVVEPFQERAQNRQQHLRLELPNTPLPALITDPNSLDRILAELLNNACKYTPPGEGIVVRAAVEAKHLLLSVCNSGIEIPTQELPHIFDKFYRVLSTDPWKQGGTGLGLALVQKLVEHLQGAIQVESNASHTRFTIILPIDNFSR
jgi:PAS domain S-box-containing protein